MSTSPSAPPGRAAAMPPEERRAAIIDAVRPLLADHREAITTKQIACAAGVAEGTIFRVFADKDQLLDAALDAALDPEPLEAALRAIDAELPFERRLVAATELIQRRVVDVWTLLSHLAPKRHARVSRPMTDSPALVEIFAAHPERIRVAPEVAARNLRALALSLTHPMIAAEQASASEVVDILLHGVGTREST